MEQLYETKISNARWMAYDLPGNVGWILYCVCVGLLFARGPLAFAFAALVPALLMLLGVGELISERIRKLDRVLPYKRLLRGFGALLLGGLLGAMAGLCGLALRAAGLLPLWMTIGGALCAVFAALLYWGYKPQVERRVK